MAGARNLHVKEQRGKATGDNKQDFLIGVNETKPYRHVSHIRTHEDIQISPKPMTNIFPPSEVLVICGSSKIEEIVFRAFLFRLSDVCFDFFRSQASVK